MKHAICFSLTVILSTLFATAQTPPKAILPGHTNDIDAVSYAQTGFIATGSFDEHINIYKADSPFHLVKTLTGHMGPVNVVAFNKTGKLLASASEDRVIFLWDSLWRLSKRFEAHRDKVNCLIFDNYGRYLFSGSDDKTFIVWDIISGKPVKNINNGQPVTAIAPKDVKSVYVAGTEPKIKLYDLMTGKVVKTLDGHTDAVNDIAITKDGKFMVSGSNDKTARVWDLNTGKQLRILPVDCWKVTTVSLSDDGKYAVTGCNDGSLKVWEIATGKLIQSVDGTEMIARNVVFGPNNQTLLAAYMLRSGTEYGLRVYPSQVPAPQTFGKLVMDSTLKSGEKRAPLNPSQTPPAPPANGQNKKLVTPPMPARKP